MLRLHVQIVLQYRGAAFFRNHLDTRANDVYAHAQLNSSKGHEKTQGRGM